MVKDFSQGLQTGHRLINLTVDARMKDKHFPKDKYIKAVFSRTVLGSEAYLASLGFFVCLFVCYSTGNHSPPLSKLSHLILISHSYQAMCLNT